MRVRWEQPWPIRLLHWGNAVWLVIMAGSGLQILAAYPEMGPKGATFGWYPFAGRPFPEWLRLGGWLAGSRHWHFAFAWLLVFNALFYVGYLLASGEHRRRLFRPKRDAPDALRTAGSYLRLHNPPSRPGELYNGLQRFAYSAVLVIALVEVLTGLVLYKPVQLGWLTAAFGGYDAARAIHFLGLVALALFTVGHVVMVLVHPRALASIFTGGTRG
jgi:thiosulfate reductase cytochrome b subunit